jgi:hypothetical protein
MTATYANTSGGVNSANGLKFDVSTDGVIIKLASQTWSGVGLADGTAGWYRLVGAVADSGTTDTLDQQIRVDGAISTSGAQMNMTNTIIATGATQTVGSCSVTQPSA